MNRQKIRSLCKGFAVTFLATTTVVAGTWLGALNVNAGYLENIAEYTEGDELNNSVWNVPNDDLLVQNGKIIFTADSTSDTRLVTKSAYEKTDDYDEIFRLNCNLNIKSLQAGERFMFGVAVNTIESYGKEADSVEIYVQNDNGLWCGVRYYNESGEAVELVKKVKIGASSGKTIPVQIVATTDMKLSVTMNKKPICNQVSPVNLEGRILFTESSGCEAELSNIKIISNKYDRPENSNYCEDFEKGTLNTEIMESRMGMGAGLQQNSRLEVKEYNGNKVLMLQNARQFYVGTTQDYSNFELTFDMPYLLFEPIRDEEGAIVKDEHKQIIIGIGCPAAADQAYPFEKGAEAIVIEKNAMYNWNTKPTNRKDISRDVYGNPEENIGYSVKVRMVDTMLTVSLKSNETGKYDEMISYKLSDSTPNGRIYISTGVSAECAIDNFKITNLDNDGNVVEYGYSFFTPPTEDWEYVKYDAPYYTEPEDTETNAPGWYMAVGVSAISGVVFLLVSIVITVLRKNAKRKKEVGANEI